jgi:xanthine/uracil permease
MSEDVGCVVENGRLPGAIRVGRNWAGTSFRNADDEFLEIMAAMVGFYCLASMLLRQRFAAGYLRMASAEMT